MSVFAGGAPHISSRTSMSAPHSMVTAEPAPVLAGLSQPMSSKSCIPVASHSLGRPPSALSGSALGERLSCGAPAPGSGKLSTTSATTRTGTSTSTSRSSSASSATSGTACCGPCAAIFEFASRSTEVVPLVETANCRGDAAHSSLPLSLLQ